MAHSTTAAGRRIRGTVKVRTAQGLAMLLAATSLALLGAQASPAAAATKAPGTANTAGGTKFDGTWTVDNGGTGQIVFNADYTYTSTCRPLSTFPQATCPAPTGTYSFGISSAYITFNGSDGSTLTMRWSGPVTQPTSLSQGGYGGLIADRGTTFKCSLFYDSTYAFAKSPLAYTNAKGTQAYALGSNQALGPVNAGNYVFLAETAPGYLIHSSKC
jgi:hypothetical protein